MTDEIRDGIKGLKIGEKISALRKGMGLEIAGLAERSGVSEIVISQIESNTISPTVAALLRIAKVFEREVGYFFEEEEGEELRIEVVRKDERKKVQRMRSSGKYALSYSYQSLSYRKSHKHMLPLLVEFDIDVDEDMELLTHEGEEFLYLLKGELELRTDTEVIHLHAGDSIYFDSTIPHGFVGTGNKKPKALVTIYTPEKNDK